MRNFIVAVDQMGGIAKDNKIPWHYKEDFKFFKTMTQGRLCVMGYNTFKEIAEMRKFPEVNKELLPDRSCAIISSKDLSDTGLMVLPTPSHVNFCSQPITFIGGLRIYDFAMSNERGSATHGYVTRIKKDHGCNQFFNMTMLEDNFTLEEVLNETNELRFEKWIRK